MTNEISINQNVAILIDGNNIERSIHSESNDQSSMLNIETLVPELLKDRQLNRMVYFREGKKISSKLRDRFQRSYHGSVIACHKSADIPLTIKATQLASKVDTIIIMSGDSDYVELVTHLKAMGVRVEIAAVKSTTSKYLLEVADQFHEITNKHWFVYGKKRSNFKKTKPENSESNSRVWQTDEQRLEQSLRDKERNRKLREEKAKKEEVISQNKIDSNTEIETKEDVPEEKLIIEVDTPESETIESHSEAEEPSKTTKKVTKKKATKKVAKKASKKVAKKATKKVAKKATKKVTKKVAKKATKKVAKKATKKVTKKAAKKVTKK